MCFLFYMDACFPVTTLQFYVDNVNFINPLFRCKLSNYTIDVPFCIMHQGCTVQLLAKEPTPCHLVKPLRLIWWPGNLCMPVIQRSCCELKRTVISLISLIATRQHPYYPDSKVHGANMGPNWVLTATDGPRDGPMNLVVRICLRIWSYNGNDDSRLITHLSIVWMTGCFSLWTHAFSIY